MNSGDSSPQWAGAFGAFEAAECWPAVPTLRGDNAAGNTPDVNVHQQLLTELAGGDSLLLVPPLEVLLHEAHQNGLGGGSEPFPTWQRR